MAAVDKRYFAKPWLTHDDTKMIKQRFFEARLPRLKPVGEHSINAKHPLPRQSKRHAPTILPPIARSISSGSVVGNSPMVSSSINLDASSITTINNSAAHEAAQRFILRNNMAKFSHEPSSAHLTNSLYARRSTLYSHVQAKIDTGLPRTESIYAPEFDLHQLEPMRPVYWTALKHEIEQDAQIRAHTKRIQFNTGITYATQLTNLGDLVRSKVKSHLTSTTGSGDERYKIVVHLTVFPTTAAGLHVASRCLWDTRTDNSITIKMQGVDCNILIVVFLCYTDIGAI